MPEAAIDEYRHLRSSEHDIRAAREARLGSDVYAEAEALAVKERTKRPFRARADTAVALHHGAHSLR